MLLVVIIALCISGAFSESSVYDDGTGVVRTETKEYTDESGNKHIERKITKQERKGNSFIEKHFVQEFIQEPVREILSVVNPTGRISHFNIQGNHERRQGNFGPQINHMNGHPDRERVFQNDHRKQSRDPDLNVEDYRRTTKDDSQDTSALRFAAGRKNGDNSFVNKPPIIIDEQVKPTAAGDGKLEFKSSTESLVQRNRSDQEVNVNDGFKVYFGDGDNERVLTAHKNTTNNTERRDDGVIVFESEPKKSHAEDDTNIMKIENSKEVSSTTEAVVETVELDNRNIFDVQLNCKQGTTKIKGKCVDVD